MKKTNVIIRVTIAANVKKEKCSLTNNNVHMNYVVFKFFVVLLKFTTLRGCVVVVAMATR